MLPWQPFLAFCIWGAHWCHLKNTTEPSMCGADAANLIQVVNQLSNYFDDLHQILKEWHKKAVDENAKCKMTN